ncbi:MAG: hypothetical protein AAGI17_08180 [Planctomycetota bacterium]
MQRVITLGVAALAGSASAQTVSVAGIFDEEFATRFNDTGSNAVAGSIYAPNASQNAIGQIADFSGASGGVFNSNVTAAVAFIQNGPYYLQNPNSLAFAGPGRYDIAFSVGIETVSLAVRGTEAGDTAGPNGAFPFTTADGAFADASGTVWALDINGDFIAGSATNIVNGDLQGPNAIDEINFDAAILGETIWGLAFVNATPDANSGIFIGGLGVTTPTPGAAAILGLGGVMASRRRP